MSTVLLVEDEDHLALGLRFNLENAGYEVRLANRGDLALELIEQHTVDLVVLDVGLPGKLDGFDVAREIRRLGNYIPIIMLTSRDQLEDRIRGLDAGADDYVTKPFDLDELIARVRVNLRRQVWSRKPDDGSPQPDETPLTPDQPPPPLTFGNASIDFATFRATTHDGRNVQLSLKEAMVMRLFAENPTKVIPRATFLERVWGEPGTLETRTVDNFILRLRKLFEPKPKKPRYIQSVRGVGYRFVP